MRALQPGDLCLHVSSQHVYEGGGGGLITFNLHAHICCMRTELLHAGQAVHTACEYVHARNFTSKIKILQNVCACVCVCVCVCVLCVCENIILLAQ